MVGCSTTRNIDHFSFLVAASKDVVNIDALKS